MICCIIDYAATNLMGWVPDMSPAAGCFLVQYMYLILSVPLVISGYQTVPL